VAQADIRDINGMITKDKFCWSRPARLQLTWSRYDVYLQRKGRTTVHGYPSDEHAHPGGSHETAAVADKAADQPTSRRPTPLGSGLSAPPAVDAAIDTGAGNDQLPDRTGGGS
jgi:hypothetical protein